MKPPPISPAGRASCRITATSIITSADRNATSSRWPAKRSGIPVAWTSEQIIDRERLEVRFTHLKAFTKGMHVVWKFTDTA